MSTIRPINIILELYLQFVDVVSCHVAWAEILSTNFVSSCSPSRPRLVLPPVSFPADSILPFLFIFIYISRFLLSTASVYPFRIFVPPRPQ